VTRQGLRELLFTVADLVESTPEFPLHDEAEDKPLRVLYKYQKEEPTFEITRESDGTFVVKGEELEKLFKMTNFEREESIRRFARQMRG
ncbi:GTPase ObgE, partial [Pseudomonas sp. FW305-BF6]|uniref:Obg family GTPase CgtA n=1 Tax=Pseudomonas sp. FW305-BF6 TaxID=2070673 RepID=UPI000CC29DCC